MITSKDVKKKHVVMINRCLGTEERGRILSDHAYAFYYNQLSINKLNVRDADRYANLNTILGYDVGIDFFRKIDSWFWNNGFDLILVTGSPLEKELMRIAAKSCRVNLDFSKWTDFTDQRYSYSYFENGDAFK